MGASYSSPNSPSLTSKYAGWPKELQRRRADAAGSSRAQHNEQVLLPASRMHKHRHNIARRSYSMPPQHSAAAAASGSTRCVAGTTEPQPKPKSGASVSRSRSNLQAITHKVSTGKGVLRARGKRMYTALRNRVGVRLGLADKTTAHISCIGGGIGKARPNAQALTRTACSAHYTPTWRALRSKKGKQGREHARQLRELMSSWTAAELHCLVVEFDAALAVGELVEQADASRAPARSLADDFGALFDAEQHKWTAYLTGAQPQPPPSTCDIVVHLPRKTDAKFAAHRLILESRSLFFRDLLFNEVAPTRDAQGVHVVLVPDSLGGLAVSAMLLECALKYLYAGESRIPCDVPSSLVESVKAAFGVSRESVHETAHTLLCSLEATADCALVFPPSNAALVTRPSSACDGDESDDGDRPTTSAAAPATAATHNPYGELSCHSVVLAARSAFLRSLIERRRGQQQQEGEGLLQMLLDEGVLPRVYAPVLLHALYTDTLALDKVIRDCPLSVSSLSEVQAIASGKCQLSPVDEATQIYHIAKFLEFDQLAQACESVVASHICLDSLPSIYNWSAESYGSPFVRRQCVAYLVQEFHRVANPNCPVLFDLEESLLVEALKSDFVQACEADILCAVVRWGEHQLVRRMEEREPNILSGTTHSISRKGVRRGDLSDHELKQILWQLLPLVRTDFIIPPAHPALTSALARGLLSAPTASASRSSLSDSQTDSDYRHWRHQHQVAKTVRRQRRPRVYVPHVDEANKQLHKRLALNPELAATLVCHHKSCKLPPALRNLCGMSTVCSGCTADDDTVSLSGGSHLRRHNTNTQTNNSAASTLCRVLGGNSRGTATLASSTATTGTTRSSSTTDSTTGDEAVDQERRAMLPDEATMAAMQTRLAALVADNELVSRAVLCGCTYHPLHMFNQLCVRVVREFGLADDATRLLKHTHSYYPAYSHARSHDALYEQLLTQHDLVGYADSEAAAADDGSSSSLGESMAAECSGATGQMPDITHGTDTYPRPTSLSKSEDMLRSMRVSLDALTVSCVQLADTLPRACSSTGQQPQQRSLSMHLLMPFSLPQHVDDPHPAVLL